MLPTVNLDKLSDYLKNISYDDFEIFWAVKKWIIENIIEEPSDDFVNSIIGALIEEKLI